MTLVLGYPNREVKLRRRGLQRHILRPCFVFEGIADIEFTQDLSAHS